MNVQNICTTLMEPADLNTLLDLCVAVVTESKANDPARLAAVEILAQLVIEKQRRTDNGEVFE